jgi:replication factor C subunit 1
LEREEVVEKMESVSEKVAVKSSPRKSPHKTKSSSPSKSNIEESSKDHDVGEIGVKDPNYVVAVPPTEDQDVLEIPQGEEMCLSGLKFVVTGQLQTLSREALIDLISMYGG